MTPLLAVPTGRHWRQLPEKGEAQARIPAPELSPFQWLLIRDRACRVMYALQGYPLAEPPAPT